MDAIFNRRKARYTKPLLLALIVASGFFAGRSAEASAMNRTLHARSQQTRANALVAYTRAEQALNSYYAAALQARALNVFVPRVLRNIQSEQGLLHPSAFVAYLEWRRSLAPARFDFYHPRIAQAIFTDQQIRQSLVTTPPITPTVNPNPGTITPPTDVIIPPVTTPEPSSVVIAVMMIGAGFWGRRRSMLVVSRKSAS